MNALYVPAGTLPDHAQRRNPDLVIVGSNIRNCGGLIRNRMQMTL